MDAGVNILDTIGENKSSNEILFVRLDCLIIVKRVSWLLEAETVEFLFVLAFEIERDTKENYNLFGKYNKVLA